MITEIIKDYKILQSHLDELINVSGYKLSYIADQMGISSALFYYKRKNNKFSIDETERLLTVIRAEELLDRLKSNVLREMKAEREA